jgi:DNA-binding IscR family transcriptional regulator
MLNRYLLGDARLHRRVQAATRVLAYLIRRAPRPASLEQLVRDTGLAERAAAATCEALRGAGLIGNEFQAEIAQHMPAGQRGGWTLRCDPAMVTLETVFIALAGPLVQLRDARAPAEADLFCRSADLFISQATLNINVALLAHLRQFTLSQIGLTSAARWQPLPMPRKRRLNPSAAPAADAITAFQ